MMAGDWIKMRADLFTHPKVVRIASAHRTDTLRTVGALMSVWCLFDAHSEDGRLDGYTTETLDMHLRWPGFSESMIGVGWLEFDGESLVLPRFDAHNGQSAKRRAQEADRKREARKASAEDADKKRTREEKRREDISPSLRSGEAPAKPARFDPLSLELPTSVPADAWASWIAYRRSRKLSTSEQTARAQVAKLAEWAASGHQPEQIIAESISNGWQGLFPPKAPASQPARRVYHDISKMDYTQGVDADGRF